MLPARGPVQRGVHVPSCPVATIAPAQIEPPQQSRFSVHWLPFETHEHRPVVHPSSPQHPSELVQLVPASPQHSDIVGVGRQLSPVQHCAMLVQLLAAGVQAPPVTQRPPSHACPAAHGSASNADPSGRHTRRVRASAQLASFGAHTVVPLPHRRAALQVPELQSRFSRHSTHAPVAGSQNCPRAAHGFVAM